MTALPVIIGANGRLTANERAVALTGRDYISHSAISTYQQCPLRYYFTYVERLPEETVAASLVFGGAVHAAIEHHFRELLVGNDPPTVDAMLDAYHAEWKQRGTGEVQFGKEGTRDSLDSLASKMLSSFQASDASQPNGQIIAIEDELREPLLPGVPDLLARIDLLVDAGDELIVTDFKTARSRWSRDQADDSAGQLLLYAELVRRLLPGKSLRLHFTVLTKTKEPAVDQHEVEHAPARIQRSLHTVDRVWRAISEEHFYPAPSPMNCPSCPFREPCRRWAG